MTVNPEEDEIQYVGFDDIDFSIITTRLRQLPFYEDDVYLGMQAMNIGIADSVITPYEYSLLQKYIETENTPMELAMVVSSLSQMWIYGLYEVLRQWKDRRYQFNRLYQNGGIDLKIEGMQENNPINLTIEVRKKQLQRYKEDSAYRDFIETSWEKIEGIYRMVELYRINLAKHCAPGKDGVVPRAPGYGRINMWCGSMDYELISKDGSYTTMNRRDIADGLRWCISKEASQETTSK